MALRFELNDVSADVTSVNVRTEKHGKEGKGMAVDVDFVAEVPADQLNQLSLGDPFAFEEVFFDESGQVKNVGISKMDIDRIFEDHLVTIQADDLFETTIEMLGTVKIKKIWPVTGRRMGIHLQAQVHPDSDQLPHLAQLLISGCVYSVKGTSRIGSEEGEEEEQKQIDIEEEGEAA